MMLESRNSLRRWFLVASRPRVVANEDGEQDERRRAVINGVPPNIITAAIKQPEVSVFSMHRARFVLAVLAVVAAGGCASAQMPLYAAPAGITPRHLTGLNLYEVSTSISYLSSGFPGSPDTAFLAPNGRPFDSSYFGTGSVTVGWERRKSKSNVSIYYTPSYTANATYPEWNTFNHALVVRFGSPRRLSQKWRFNFSIDGNISNIQQFLFAAPVYSSVVAAPSTFEDLSAAVLKGSHSNDQLGSLLTGAPLMDSPARSLFFGDRILTAGGRVSFSYVPRSRWSVDFDLGGARTQHLSSPKLNSKSNVAYVTPYVNSAQLTISASYSLSARTQLAAIVSSDRSFTGFQDAYANTVMASLGHTFGRHVFTSLQFGAGLIVPVKDHYKLPTSPQTVGGATVGVKTRSNTFLLTANRAAGDNYGVGFYSTLATSAAWQYARTGRNWWIDASFGQSWVRGTQLRDVRGWQGAAGFGRRLGAGFAVQTQYSALTYGGTLGPQYDFAIQGARLTISWTPHSELFR